MTSPDGSRYMSRPCDCPGCGRVGCAACADWHPGWHTGPDGSSPTDEGHALRQNGDPFACTGEHGYYRSPLRPLDVGYVGRHAGVTIDLDCTQSGEWCREKVHVFQGVLPARIVEIHQLEIVDAISG